MDDEGTAVLIPFTVKLDITNSQLLCGPEDLATLFICTYDGMVLCADIHLSSAEPTFSFPLPVYVASGGVAYLSGSFINDTQYVALWSYESELVFLTRTFVPSVDNLAKTTPTVSHRVVPFGNGHRNISSLAFRSQTELCFAGTHDGLLYTINAATGEIHNCTYEPGLPITQISHFDDNVYTLNQGGALQCRDETLVRAAINSFVIGKQYIVYGSFSVVVSMNSRAALGDTNSTSLDIALDSPISTITQLNLQSLSSDIETELLKRLKVPTCFTEVIPDPTYHRDYEHFLIGTISGSLFVLQVCHSARTKKLSAVLHKVPIPAAVAHERKITQILGYTKNGLVTLLFDDSFVARYYLVSTCEAQSNHEIMLSL
ncbi:hypothetical protein GL50803_0016506 [Giardia duodenalis]|uniref:Uncharacterized protein n=1 Tax=Giardia intestinalis (strain ATCC 50803 / WB clone C6) TaxID=184922 RepID=D3KGQ5_GIAIC|nr:hypothetical protein GL50803_0016506 [Giardia intestinalis]KAE8303577.1 hypothetical protein GL50803_0016506 [Giardia intestinalis]